MPELAPGAEPVPATPIGELKTWQMDIKCGGCKRRVVLRMTDLIERYGPTPRISAVIGRLKCGGTLRDNRLCGTMPSRVVLMQVDDAGRSMKVRRQITVIG